jgi:general secretion pathway protein A
VSTLSHWGLERSPFETTLDPAFFFASEDHSEALARLEFLARHEGSQLGLLTGEIGCGKSLTRAVFAQRSVERRLVAQISSSHYDFPSLMRAVLIQLGVHDPGPEAGEFDLMERLKEVVLSRRRPAVILFDEAQELDRTGLVGVRALNNLADGALDITVILVGQPELRARVRSLPQLDQRAGLRYHLRPLEADEVRRYLRWRLETAGHHDGDLFTNEAVRLITIASEGIPRQINRIARLSMAVAARRRWIWVEAGDIRAVVDDLADQRGAVVA